VLPRRWQDRLRDIVAAAEEILAFTAGMDLEAFAADPRTQKAVLADFAIIGEAARHLPDEFCDAHPDIPWQDMRDMRNFVVHVYFSVEPAVVWDTIRNDLPGLAQALRALVTESQ
jgi:uncharacterized protein with HEPN domain